MKKGGLFVVFLALVIISVISFASASFEVGNKSHEIDSSYAKNSNIQGWINISLEDEPSTSLFTDSNGNSVSLMDLIESDLDLDWDYDYFCVPSDCSGAYSATNGATSKTITLQSGVKKLTGFKITGGSVSVSSLNLTLTSDASSSIFNQIKLDFLDDEEIEIGNYRASATDGMPAASCFSSSLVTNNYSFDSSTPQKYCQRMNLSEAPAYKVGAWMQRTAASKNITFALYTSSFSSIEGATCKVSGSLVTGEVSCTINYPITEEGSYFVCLYSEESDPNTKIRGYATSPGCGFYGSSKKSETNAYDIFAFSKRFDSVGTIRIKDILPNEGSLGSVINDYLLDKYGEDEDSSGIDCSGGCVIPLALIPAVAQTVTLNNLELKYSDGGTTSTTQFYDIAEAPIKINSEGFIQISLNEGNFSTPSTYGNYSFSLDLNDEEVFSQRVLIEKAPEIYGISPTVTASAVPTTFKVYANITSANTTIVEYVWGFGDGEPEIITTTDQATHTYNSTGIYELTITVEDSNQKSSYKIFNIDVVSPKEAINSTLTKKLDNLARLKTKINTFPEFDRARLTATFDTDELNNRLKAIQSSYSTGEKTEEEYNEMMTELLGINVPDSLEIGVKGTSISFYSKREDINLDVLTSLTGGTYAPEEEDAYIDAVIAWGQENVDVKVSFNEYIAKYDLGEESVLKTFVVSVSSKGGSQDTPFLIMEDLTDLIFKESYLETKKDGYVSIRISNLPASFAFSTTDDFDFSTIPLFVSPQIDYLEPSIINIDDTPVTSNWALFILIITFLIILALVVYILLQEWYKRNYETHLFRDRNNLYNLIHYIETSKKKGMTDREIYKSLRMAKWNSEQIDYAMKKHAGKRTGMFEIPIGRITKLFRKKEVVTKPVFQTSKFALNKRF